MLTPVGRLLIQLVHHSPLTGLQDPTGPPTPGGHIPVLWAQRGAGSQQISLARPPGAAICRLSHHFHFPPPLKQPPSSLALEATQPKLLHTPSYSKTPPHWPRQDLETGKQTASGISLESFRPGPSPSMTSGTSVQSLRGLVPILPAWPTWCSVGGGIWRRPVCGRGPKSRGAEGLRRDACREGAAGPDVGNRGL